MKKIFIAVIAIPIIFWGIWFAFPKTSIQSIIEDFIKDKNLSIEIKGLGKGLFYNLSIDSLKLKTSGEERVSLNNIHCRINPLDLILFRVNIFFYGSIGSGDISGHITRTKDKIQMELDVERAGVNEIALFKLAGIIGTGTISGRFKMIDDTGHVEFFTEDASFEPVIFSGITVPLNFFHSIRGAIDIKGNIVNVVSIALEGKDIYARLKGFVRDAVMDINMEVMPGKSFIENPIFIGSLEKYKVSPGYYVIPVQGRI